MSEMTSSSLIERKDFSKIPRHLDIPDLIEIQKRSYDSFLQMEVDPDRREDKGCRPRSPACSHRGLQQHGGAGVRQLQPGDAEVRCARVHGAGDELRAPLKVRVRLVVLDKEDKSPTKKVLDVREQESTSANCADDERGHVHHQRTERVVVSQLHRSPGAFFTHDKGARTPAEKSCFRRGSSRIADVARL